MPNKAIQTTTSILCGAAAGALAMYLFDPDKGRGRRRYLAAKTADAAGSAASAAGAAVGNSLHGLANQAQQLGSAMAEHAHTLTAHARDAAAAAVSRAGNAAQDVADDLAVRGASGWRAARNYARQAAAAARKRARSLLGGQEESRMSMVGMTLTAVGALSVGVALMYLLDPMQGRRRRETIRRTAAQAAGATGEALGRAGQAVGSYATAAADQARSAARSVAAMAGEMAGALSGEALSDKIREELGRKANIGALQVENDNGRITLRGTAMSGELDSILSTVRDIRGVMEVDNQLQVGQAVHVYQEPLHSAPGAMGAR